MFLVSLKNDRPVPMPSIFTRMVDSSQHVLAATVHRASWKLLTNSEFCLCSLHIYMFILFT